MKRKSITITVLTAFGLMVLLGCGGVRIKDDQAKQLLVKTTSRIFAYKLFKNDPESIEEVKLFCEAIQDKEITQSIIDMGIDYLSARTGGDPLLAASLKDLCELVVIDISDPGFDLEIVKIIALEFLEGARLAELDII